MSWLRIDDGFAEHPKLLQLTRAERWTWVELLSFCARNSKKGTVPHGIDGHLKYVTKTLLQRYAEVGLLDEENGLYKVHDWDDYNPRDPTNADRQRRYRNTHRNTKSNATVTETVTTPSRPVLVTNKEPAPIPEPVPNKAGQGSAGLTQTVGDEALRQLASIKARL